MMAPSQILLDQLCVSLLGPNASAREQYCLRQNLLCLVRLVRCEVRRERAILEEPSQPWAVEWSGVKTSSSCIQPGGQDREHREVGSKAALLSKGIKPRQN